MARAAAGGWGDLLTLFADNVKRLTERILPVLVSGYVSSPGKLTKLSSFGGSLSNTFFFFTKTEKKLHEVCLNRRRPR